MRTARASRLERILAAVAEGHAPAPDDVEWSRTADLPSLPAMPGEAEAARREMRSLVVEFAQRCGLTAEAVHREISFYEGTSWPRELRLDACPPRLIGRRQEFAWHILRAYGRCPSEKTIRRVLEGKNLDKSRAD